MSVDFQAGLFDDEAVEVPPLDGRVRRVPLGRGAWVDLAPGWIAGADAVWANGGEVQVLRFLDGCSTTEIINAIRRQ